MVDRELVLRRVAALDVYLRQLAEARQVDEAAYANDWRVQRIVERTLHLAIEVCMDLADHLIADRALPVPGSAAEAFLVLGREGLLDGALAEALARMVGFRNLLVHDYLRLDPRRVLELATTGVADIEKFRDRVLRLV
jgi:uncharacterized protein YutE (UPF0331/DUF86 family)